MDNRLTLTAIIDNNTFSFNGHMTNIPDTLDTYESLELSSNQHRGNIKNAKKFNLSIFKYHKMNRKLLYYRYIDRMWISLVSVYKTQQQRVVFAWRPLLKANLEFLKTASCFNKIAIIFIIFVISIESVRANSSIKSRTAHSWDVANV